MSHYYAKWHDGYEVVWRNLTWAEYKKFRGRYENSVLVEPLDLALEIYKLVRIDGPDPEFAPAGIPAYICKQQMLNNPFSGRFEDLAPAVELGRRVVNGDFLLSAKALIAATLNYKPEEIDQWEPATFFIRLAQTEVVTGRTFEPVNPNAKKGPDGRPVSDKKQHRPLSTAQQKAIARTKEDRAKG